MNKDTTISVEFAIMSRGRAGTITSHKVFPNARVVVPSDEIELYAKRIDRARLASIPPEVRGISAVRNWIVRHYQDNDALVICDDDITDLYEVMGTSSRRLPRSWAEGVMENIAIMAMDAGVGAFSVGRTADARKFVPTNPFSLTGSMESVVGVIDRRVLWDETLKARTDIDWSLQHLLVNRIVWIDTRYTFSHARNKNTGGNAIVRTKAQIDADKNTVKKKWGRYVNFTTLKGTDKVSIRVPRRQQLEG